MTRARRTLTTEGRPTGLLKVIAESMWRTLALRLRNAIWPAAGKHAAHFCSEENVLVDEYESPQHDDGPNSHTKWKHDWSWHIEGVSGRS